MAAPVDLCNMALALLGDSATVSSIDPPDQSAQAGHCARFYPIAVAALQEMHTWGFCTVRQSLSRVTNYSSTWAYAYAAPSNVVNYLAILDPEAADDIEVGIQVAQTYYGVPQVGLNIYTPQPFQVEADLVSGADIIYTNQENAVLRYTIPVTDSSKFSPLFCQAVVMLLASYLAGPLIKGAEGRKAASDLMGSFFKFWKEAATESDSNQRNTRAVPAAAWMTNR